MTFLTTEEVARRWKMNPGTLRNWRSADKGPKYVQMGTSIRYHLEDIKAWELFNLTGKKTRGSKKSSRRRVV